MYVVCICICVLVFIHFVQLIIVSILRLKQQHKISSLGTFTTVVCVNEPLLMYTLCKVCTSVQSRSTVYRIILKNSTFLAISTILQNDEIIFTCFCVIKTMKFYLFFAAKASTLRLEPLCVCRFLVSVSVWISPASPLSCFIITAVDALTHVCTS